MTDPLQPTTDSVQRLVRALAAGPYPSEDAAQEAWLALLKKRLSGGEELLDWLRGAQRRSARAIRRDEARRREREQRAGERVPEESSLDSLVHLERARTLIAAVEALAEPFRSAVVLRYFEDLPPREIARRMGVPVNTARSRVRRGLEELRRTLDPETLLSFAPFVQPREESRRWERFALPFAAGAAVVALWFGWRALVGVERDDSPASLALAEAPGGDGPVLEKPLAPAGRTLLATQDPASSAAVAPVPSTPEARVRGRFVDARGAPLVGIVLVLEPGSVHGPTLSSAEGITQASLDFPAEQVSGQSAGDGRFELTLAPREHLGYSLTTVSAEFTELYHELGRLQPQEVRELGDLVLWRGATLAGRIVDGSGTACAGAWRVALGGEDAQGHEFEFLAVASEVGQEFRFERVPPGRARLTAESLLGATLETVELELADGDARTLELVHEGTDLSRRLLVVVSSELPGAPRLDPQALTFTQDGAAHVPTRVTGRANQFLFEDVEARAGTLRVEDERCEPLQLDDVRPGRLVPLVLRGSAAVHLEVRGSGGEPLTHLRVSLRARAALGMESRLLDGAAPLDGVLRGLFPGDFTLLVSAEREAERELELDGLAPGEVRALSVQLGRHVTLAGTLLDATGAPCGGVEVSCLAPAAEADSAASPVLRLELGLAGPGTARYRREVLRARSAADGSFRFELPAAGTWIVAVLPPAIEFPVARSVRVTEDVTSTGTVLTLSSFQR